MKPIELLKLSQVFLKKSQDVQTSNENVKTLVGVNQLIFGPKSWNFVNQIMNVLNSYLSTLSNSATNFQSITRNPTDANAFTGSMKSLANLSMALYKIITKHQEQAYTVDETSAIIDNFTTLLNNSEFPEPNAQGIKTKITDALNGWKNIL